MKPGAYMKIARADGIKAALLRAYYELPFASHEQIGTLAERLGNTARLDGLTFSLDNPLLTRGTKGGIVLDVYEEQACLVFEQCFPKDEPLIELGGSIGVMSCKISRKLLRPEQHIVVEANRELIPTLRKNRDLNHCKFEIIEAALAYDTPVVTFYKNDGSTGGSVYHYHGENEGDQVMQVPALTLKSIAEKAGFHQFNLVADIEGSEFDLIEREMGFLREHVGLMLLEIHFTTHRGEEAVYTLVDRIQAEGFEVIGRRFNNYCFRNQALLKPE